MTMKLVQLPLYLTAGEAHTLIDFLSQVQHLLMENYGAQIQRDCRTDTLRDDSTPEPDFDDPLPF